MLNARKTDLIFFLLLPVTIWLVYANVLWWGFLAGLILVYLAVLVAGTVNIGLRFFVPAHNHGRRDVKMVSLTFDDGPDEATLPVAECLAGHNVQGAFFLIGKRVKEMPEVVVRLTELGHTIGNHGYYHQWWFPLKLPALIFNEIALCQTEIERVSGLKPRFFRPPFGITNPWVAKAVRRSGLLPVGWDVRSFDTVIGVSERLSKRLKSRVRNGSIILLHENGEGMVGFLNAFIPWLREQGYEIVSLDKLLHEQAYN